ncbi:hypothetical protein [Lederbergia galactosidilytica]|nr:hypothetical protein [Lederbergia galactosidilytica]MBP1913981.1 hypothetical protein [Lederbergia galactosidilytica]
MTRRLIYERNQLEILAIEQLVSPRPFNSQIGWSIDYHQYKSNSS